MTGTGVFMPRVAAEPQQHKPWSRAGAGQRSWSCTSLSSPGQPGSPASDTASGVARSWSLPGGPRQPCTVRRVPWRAAGGPEPAAQAGPLAAAGLASSFTAAELGDAAAFLNMSSSPPACLLGAGDDPWGSLGGRASNACVAAAPPQPGASWLPGFADGGLGEPSPHASLGLAAAGGSSSPVLIPLPAAGMHALLAAPPVSGGSLSAAAIGAPAPELCSDASLAGWSDVGSASDQLLTASGSLLQLADDAAETCALHSLDAELSALLQLQVQPTAQQAASLAPAPMQLAPTALPAAMPAAAAAPAWDLVSAMAQRKLQQLAAVQVMGAQLQAEVAALLPL